MRLIKSILFVLISLTAMASSPWMDYSLNYFKIKVAEDGIYRISQNVISNSLSTNGFSASSVDSSKWALFFRGQEIPLYYDDGDIYFYAQRNTGVLDTGLYFDDGLANPYLNLYSDTTAYFLSWYTDSRTGLRMQSQSLSSPTSTNYHFATKEWRPNAYRYFAGENYNGANNGNLFMGSFQPGEGWTGPRSSSSLSISFDSLDNLFSGINPYLRLHFIAESRNPGSFDIDLGNSSVRTWKSNINSNGTEAIHVEGEIQFSDIEANSLSVNVPINSRVYSLAHGSLYFPQTINMYGETQKTFLLDSGLASELSFVINDLSINNASEVLAFDISDLSNPSLAQINYNQSLNELEVGVSNAQQVHKKIALARKSDAIEIQDITYRSYINLTNPDQDLIMIHPDQFDSAALAYYNYRKSPAGGNYNPLKISIDEVYDQFSYGEYTPIGVRELCRYMHFNSSADNNYLFLMGKGLYFIANTRINGIRYYYRFNPEIFVYKDLVTTYGWPGGDAPFVMNFDQNDPNRIAFGVGRITAQTEQEVLDYLEKVMESEDPVNKGLWRKRILHMSGGIEDSEISRFYSYVEQFRKIAEDPYMGAKVQTISKTQAAGVQTILVDTVINRGISLLTMYGHSSLQFNDIEIGDVNDPNLNYNNGNGQYPMFLINGCETGNIFGQRFSWAQSWINTPKKGALLFLAHSYEGYDPILKFYSEHFYKTAFSDSLYFGKPVGDILTKSIRNFSNQYSVFYGKFIQAQIELMTLQGDPSLRLTGGSGKADYAVNEDGILARSYDGSKITSNTDSFELVIPLENYGIFTDESIGLLVERINPVQRIFDTIFFQSFGYTDTAYFRIYNNPDNLQLGGLNQFKIYLDPDNRIPEEDESNNNADFEFLIPVQTVRNVSPMDFGIVSNSNLRLASTAQLPDGQSQITYQFEVDTSYLFDSPVKYQIQKVSGNTAFSDITLSDLFPLQDSMVFYWRSKRLEDTIWSESSFTYIDGSSSGWTQREYGQYIRNDFFDGLELDPNSKNFDFLDFTSSVDVRFAGRQMPFRDTTYIKIGNGLLRSNDASTEWRKCAANRLLAVKISGKTGQPYRDLKWYEPSCGIQPPGIMQLSNNSIRIDSIPYSMMNFVNNIRSDDYLMLLSQPNIRYDFASPALRDTLMRFGFDTTLWDDLSPTEPFFFLGKRNWPGSFFIRGDTNLAISVDSQVFDLNYILTESYRFGKMKSRVVGPAKKWSSVSYKMKQENSDSTKVDLFGIRSNGSEELIISNLSDFRNLDNIDSDEFPKLYISAYKEDTLSRTSPQLSSWTILFDGSPEGLLDGIAFGPDYYEDLRIQQGDTLHLNFSFRNISEFSFEDSLLVRFTIAEDTLSEIRISGPDAGDSVVFDLTILTSDLDGDYKLRTFVNPYLKSELFYDNNILETDFEVFRDETPPIISATFDGNRIVNGDVVPYDTEIKITLKDENPFFRLSDSNSIFFNIYLRDNFIDSAISIKSENISWNPQSEEEDFSLFIQPDSLHDGIYLLEFNGRDASGNLAGAFPKTIEFEVQSAIPSEYEEISLYPNPFQNAFIMTFNLKGKDKPEKFLISIFDINGQLIRRSNFLDKIKLGDNRLELWDGKNSEGQIVSSGIYIYRIELESSNPESNLNQPIVGKVLFNP